MHHVFGHTSPDTDAFVSAFAFAHWLNAQGTSAQAYRLGEPNLETAFVLARWFERYPNDELPAKLLPYLNPNRPTDIVGQGDKVALTDHNEPAQSIKALAEFDIRYVIDHHKLGLTTPTPAYVYIHPVGCTCTILYEMFTQKGVDITASMAWLMLCAIISDTLNLSSPTTTDDDRLVVQKLCELCQMSMADKDKLADEMFSAKSDVSHLSACDILLMDYKSYEFGATTWGIAGIETVAPSQIFTRIDELTATAKLIQAEKGVDYLMIAVVDIKEQMGYALAHGPAQNVIISKAFGVDCDDKVFALAGVVSRKKQIVPALERYYQLQA
ncbi:manganese-dependent inorganic pyrophosphatase [Moraxella lacunata]|uniref:inorganic diphosphatase n=1 Tax=Moraxella lacunata TaxID=477 RepID=A0A1V4GT67_MORLA|nr:manganese-dependent inorganic pyrophosphatase [Moraxella lacunata]OPH35807.1 manganese-dependent inorganic pyrophosphatase [Moraxella lacunata]